MSAITTSDGTADGYVDRLSGTDIPLIARILAVSDAFSAMTTTRPYRKALDVAEALRRLEDAAGSQLDADARDGVRQRHRDRGRGAAPGDGGLAALDAVRQRRLMVGPSSVARGVRRPVRGPLVAAGLVTLAVLAAGLAPAALARNNSWTLTRTPTTVQELQPTTIAFLATNTSDGGGGGEIGCIEIVVPTAYTVNSVSVVSAPAGSTWKISKAAGPGLSTTVRVKASGGGSVLLGDPQDESVGFDIDVTGLLPGTTSWVADAFNKADCTNDMSLTKSLPMTVALLVVPTPTPAPTATPTPAPTATPTPTPSPVPTPTPTPVATPTRTPPTSTPTPHPTTQPASTPLADRPHDDRCSGPDREPRAHAERGTGLFGNAVPVAHLEPARRGVARELVERAAAGRRRRGSRRRWR